MLSQVLNMGEVLPNMDSMILITHMTPRWPSSTPRSELWYSGLPVIIHSFWIYCVPQLDSILHAPDRIPNLVL